MKICVVIPIYNECETIGFVVDSVLRKGFDAIVVNDGSTDASEVIAQERGAKVISNEHKTGKGASLRRGFEQALEDGYDAVIAMDGDGQHDAEDLCKFTRMAESNPQTVINGTRMANTKGMPLIRLITNKLMSWMISLVCRQKIPDTQCGFRYIHTDILRKISLHSTAYEIETEMLIQSASKGYPIYSVPIRTIYSKEKSKVRPVQDAIRFIKYFSHELRNKCSKG